ncbi:MAG: T9SS type A sorting domain-containing protein [Candidatus Kapaibacterium sp.]
MNRKFLLIFIILFSSELYSSDFQWETVIPVPEGEAPVITDIHRNSNIYLSSQILEYDSVMGWYYTRVLKLNNQGDFLWNQEYQITEHPIFPYKFFERDGSTFLSSLYTGIWYEDYYQVFHLNLINADNSNLKLDRINDSTEQEGIYYPGRIDINNNLIYHAAQQHSFPSNIFMKKFDLYGNLILEKAIETIDDPQYAIEVRDIDAHRNSLYISGGLLIKPFLVSYEPFLLKCDSDFNTEWVYIREPYIFDDRKAVQWITGSIVLEDSSILVNGSCSYPDGRKIFLRKIDQDGNLQKEVNIDILSLFITDMQPWRNGAVLCGKIDKGDYDSDFVIYIIDENLNVVNSMRWNYSEGKVNRLDQIRVLDDETLLVAGSTDWDIYVAEIGNFLGVDPETAKQSPAFPNPAQDYINIHTENNMPAEIIIKNHLGQTVIRRKAENSNSFCRINISDLTQGVYFYNIYSSGQISNGSFLIAR